MFESVKLNNLFNLPGSKKRKVRVGRGIGSGCGKTSGKGVKGQKSRRGVAIKGFEGGQTPLIKRLPKRGFNPLVRNRYAILDSSLVNYMVEEKVIEEGSTITKEILFAYGIIRSLNDKVKLLGSEELKYKINFEIDACSEKFKAQIEKLGGKI